MTFRSDHEYKIEYDNDFSILDRRLRLSCITPISLLDSLLITNMSKSEDSENVVVLKLESRIRTQSRTRSLI